MRITWDGNIEEGNKAKIEKYLEKWSWLKPDWLSQIYVDLKESDGGWWAQISTNYKYRSCVLNISNEWLNINEFYKEECIVHELIHNFFNPLFLYSDDTIDILLEDDEKFKKSVKEQLKLFNELGAQDLTKVLMERYG